MVDAALISQLALDLTTLEPGDPQPSYEALDPPHEDVASLAAQVRPGVLDPLADALDVFGAAPVLQCLFELASVVPGDPHASNECLDPPNDHGRHPPSCSLRQGYA